MKGELNSEDKWRLPFIHDIIENKNGQVDYEHLPHDGYTMHFLTLHIPFSRSILSVSCMICKMMIRKNKITCFAIYIIHKLKESVKVWHI